MGSQTHTAIRRMAVLNEVEGASFGFDAKLQARKPRASFEFMFDFDF